MTPLDQTDQYLDFATSLARQAGKILLTHATSKLEIETKADHTPVTQVDKMINALVIDAIKKQYPSHGLLGEEADLGDGTETMQWVCDPLDGTKAYIIGLPVSSFMLALLDHGHAKMSVVFDPFSNRLYHAVRGQGAFCNSKPIRVSQASVAGNYIVLQNSALACLPELYKARGQFLQAASTSFRCMLVARGKAAGYINRNADHHDMGPGSLIIEEAGGKVTGLDGKPVTFNQAPGTVIASNGVCHDELLKIARASLD